MRLKINRQILKIAGILTAAIFLVVVGISLLSKWESKQSTVEIPAADIPNTVAEMEGQLYLDGTSYLPKEKLETFLLIGVDKYEADTKAEIYVNVN